MGTNRKADKWRISAIVLASALALAACGKGDKAPAPPAPMVSVLTVHPETVTVDTELTGRLKPIRESQVRARVAGILLKRLFTEGTYVKEGQPLFQIDNAPYVASLQSARASLATAQANAAKADADIVRYRPLVAANAISKQEFDQAIAQQRLAHAQIDSAQAAIKSAQINVGYAYVRAPISGRIGKALVTEGALVGQNDVTQLALIQQTHTLYVDLTQTAAQAMKIRQDIAAGKMKTINGAVEVAIKLDDGSEYPQKGRLLFTDMTVDEGTGEVKVRAEIPNDDDMLLPGQFVRVEIPQAEIQNAIVLPQQAITRGASGDTVTVVNADGSLAVRNVTVVQQKGTNWVISGGLRAGDKVAMDGLALVQLTGAKKVQTQPWKPAPANGAPVPQAKAASASAPKASAASASQAQ
ncbi:efflux RND transporter periplasmic adaptor subunit [Snodgrassella alvi]|uniref:efflux RND transporter periplasmic adaptor subunit n=1 Tax=Snodgrassella alvi TaxID=1196083 RepID=UPI0009968F8A|nr:efflux RND transporter periplasmic adaptor subunit [Snodgrassella alvi]OOX78969.1 efflux transporter periplasmic adaptor subunit [Snodgrassella alvi]ORF04547.1 efflux transporter periplasmic adaptor subunit [Snodgrassella alvi]ORF28074.1 efflux transporter periplasmic adaptor subunit [Snodgrassella alvi]ORF31691.1 efflux transporter periplasmic adaptor subunit [Snodgrassella alvi]PXY98686.1 efflux RND transporter periplasmic adaptor subunit [Snodgrassella alvi]